MTTEIPLELSILVISILFFISILVSKADTRFGVPALLLFLGVGMLFGSDGLGIAFEDLHVTQNIGSLALCVILFSGGLDTKIGEIRPVIRQGITLATFGVLITALVTGLFTWWILGLSYGTAIIGLTTSLLLACTLSSTDSASVFSILRTKGIRLKHNIRPLLELESGSNDPMAYILTITLTQILVSHQEPSIMAVFGSIIMQLTIGGGFGYIFGRLAVKLLNKIQLSNSSLYPILVMTIGLFIFSSVFYMKGNAYLAVYVGGLIIGNASFPSRRNSMNFTDGLAWLSQLMMFLTLGLLVNPNELIPLIIPGVIISLLMIFIARPISVFLCLAPFKGLNFKTKTFISWVGLRGAVPIIFAIIPLTENIPHARVIFNIVFLCTLISLIIQGTTLNFMAKWLGLIEKGKEIKKPDSFDVQFTDEIKSVLTEMTLAKEQITAGMTLKDVPFPPKTLVIMVKRDTNYFVPTGNTELFENDTLLIVSDHKEESHDKIAQIQKKIIAETVSSK